MINGIPSANSYDTTYKNAQFNQEQQSTIADTLAEFDPENLSTEGAQAIISAFSEAGIKPGKQLGQLMADAGFDAKAIGELAGVDKGQRPPPPPDQNTQASIDLSSIAAQFAELVSDATDSSQQYANLSQDSKDAIYTQLVEELGLDAGQSIIDVKV
ncbi:hypothetical protein PCIT_b0196 [Pseudoalteromonas citrea]|uniref:Uncharacterized protein n=2 Tax=Pseudoalteromonas citrea TaxID=43655 RepID=A0AAD4FPM3_9GAMM|nr:hypothetical protein [Pseudoalteromonas citrea]KAF7764250.1 hypothetical protein PCIT_b0196 [Pseudoalteromonas citrea]